MSSRNKIYFTSDAHLGSGFHPDPLEVERCLVRWLISIKPSALAVYFLGDIFDYWFEYKNVVPRGHTRFLGTLALMRDEGVEIHFFAGNHDVWFSDYLEQELGATIHHRSEVVELLGKRFRLSHGDEEYTQERWSYKLLYHIFRSPLCRWLYAGIHPRWTVGFALAWSLHSRKQGLKKRTIGQIPHAYRNEYFEVENELLVRFTKTYMLKNPEIDFFLYGHRHIMLDLMLKDGKRMMILGDWLQYKSYAVWDGEHLSLEQFEQEE